MTPTEQNLTEALALLRELDSMSTKADAEQWQRPERERGGGESRSGQPNDPTGELASDMDRLALRSAVQKTEIDSKRLLIGVRLMHTRLKKALKPYGGA